MKKATKKTVKKAKTTPKRASTAPAPFRGGVRAGAGRKRIYREQLIPAFTARVNDEQGEAIGDWCREAAVPPATLFREVALAAISHPDARELERGTQEIPLAGASCFPVKFTPAQAKAVRDFCTKHGIKPMAWMREAVLRRVGRPDLGMSGALSTLSAALPLPATQKRSKRSSKAPVSA
jgi:hypothetical protein